MELSINKPAAYFLKTPDGAVYGPVDMLTLCLWATDARVIPGCQFSENQATWAPVETIPELRLNWSVQFSDGTTYGPLNLLAIRVLATEQSIPSGAKLLEKGSARTAILDDSIMSLLVEECHQMLAGCGDMMRASLASLRSAYQLAHGEAEQRGAALVDSRVRLEKAEADLAASTMKAAEYGAKFIEVERALRLEQERSGRALVEATRMTSEQEGLRQAADRSLGAMRTLVADLESKCAAAEKARALEQERAGRARGDAAQMASEAEKMSHRLAAIEATVRNRDEAIRNLGKTVQDRDEAVRKLETIIQEFETTIGRLEEAVQAREEAIHNLEGRVQSREEAIQKLEAAEAESHQQAEQQMAHMRAKVDFLNKALQVASQQGDALAFELGQAKESSRKLQTEGQLALNSLKERLEKELAAALQKNRELLETNNSLSGQLEAARKESDRKERESAGKFKQIEAEIKDSTELVAKTMREMEHRERLLHDSQKVKPEAAPGPRKKHVVVEAEVLHSEVIHAEPIESVGAVHKESSPDDSGAGIPLSGRSELKGHKAGMLTSVEAQLQAELRKWESLKRDQKKSRPKWF